MHASKQACTATVHGPTMYSKLQAFAPEVQTVARTDATRLTRSSGGAVSGTCRLSPRRVIFIITCRQDMFGDCTAQQGPHLFQRHLLQVQVL